MSIVPALSSIQWAKLLQVGSFSCDFAGFGVRLLTGVVTHWLLRERRP